MSANVHATLDAKQLISHTRSALVDTIASLQHSDSEVITASEVHEHEYYNSGHTGQCLSKWVSNMTHILACLFNSAIRQCCAVWVSQSLFLHNIKDFLPPSEVCLYGCICWSLTQAHHNLPHGLSQYPFYMRDIRAKPKAGFQFNF